MLSHTSALHATRLARSEQVDIRLADPVTLTHQTPWVGKRWSTREFVADVWKWQRPSSKNALHVMVASRDDRIWMQNIKSHVCTRSLPANSIVWLDDYASVVTPPLLFLQMASVMSFPMLVLLGHELCGGFTRDAVDPLEGPLVDDIPAATSVEEISDFLRSIGRYKGIEIARRALDYVSDHAVSAPEAVMSTVYALPKDERGYGMGPVTLNKRARLGPGLDAKSRYPDLMFGFAPVGINYDGSEHLDLDALVASAKAVVCATEENAADAKKGLQDTLEAVRAKVVDDNTRNRQLAACGKLVFPATKENLYGEGHLDAFTRDLLRCAHEVFGVDVSEYENALDDSELCKERYELLESMLPLGRSKEQARETL